LKHFGLVAKEVGVHTGNKQRPAPERKKERKKERRKAFAMWLVDSRRAPSSKGLKAAGKEWGPPYSRLFICVYVYIHPPSLMACTMQRDRPLDSAA
jgi:hypothetical protein